jgi:thiamine pyrophosphokinase
MRILILTNGDPPSAELAQRLAADHDLLMAADGAAHRAVGLGLIPDIICGDFDSIRLEVARVEFPSATFLPTPDQDWADLEKAILLARERGADSITILGASGGRIDHTLANFALLLRYHAEIALQIVDDHSVVRALSGTEEAPGELVLTTQPGDIVSLISLGGTARATITGVQWPLNAVLLPIGTHGISNRATADRVTVRARGGALLVCHLCNPPNPLPPSLQGKGVDPPLAL